ncbi:MAG: fumarylacetoacetate hydrolase family protein [Chloroflexota bacterium]
MKIVRFKAENRTRYGILSGDSVQAIVGKPYRGIKTTADHYPLNKVKLLSPCAPSKIVALGLNYRAHVEEASRSAPGVPRVFLKAPTAMVGPEDNIVYPPSSTRVDYEGELAVVIGERAHYVPAEKWRDCIFGYTCLNDVSARDFQAQDNMPVRAKSFDTFAPIGPCIETDLDPANTILETYLNGELRQHVHTRELIYPVPELIAFITNIMTLLPGDVIATGTPSGIGPMKPGDTVEVKIEGIGTLRNHVVMGRS